MMDRYLKWNPVCGSHGVPKLFGTYLITVASAEDDGSHYHESRKTVVAQFQKIKSGYRWVYDDKCGTNTLTNTCESSWTFEGTAYSENIVAWAYMPAPYNEDWSAILSVIKSGIDYGVAEDGSVTVDFWRGK